MNNQSITKYQYKDLIKYQDTSIYSSIGNPIDSKKPKAPKYSFGTSTRDAYLKRFGNKYAPVDQSLGRHQPSPERGYKYTQKQAPSYKIGTGPKNSLDKIKQYDHYKRKDIGIDIREADRITKRKSIDAKFSGDRRFLVDKGYLTPGPQDYSTIANPQKCSPPKYTMSPRRNKKSQDIFMNLSATSQIIGPGAYMPEQSHIINGEPTSPSYSIPKTLRKSFVDRNTIDTNQSYDMSESLGEQLISKRRKYPACKIGKERRDGKKSQIFVAHMEKKPASVRISLPKI